METFKIDYGSIKSNVKMVSNSTNSVSIIVNNVTSIEEAIFMSKWESFNLPTIKALIFKINMKIDKNATFLENVIKSRNAPILLSFTSLINNHESITLWKIRNDLNVYSIYIDNDDANATITELLHRFVVQEIEKNRNGIIPSPSSDKYNPDLTDIGDENGNNLLYLAAKENNLEAVKFSISLGFDAEANQIVPVIDAVWNKFLTIAIDDDHDEKIKSIEIMKILLNANSRFPTIANWFENENLPQEIKDFIQKCESIHNLVDQDNFDEFDKELKKDENLIFYYNRFNESVFVHGLKVKKYKIISYIKKGLSIGCHEDLDKVYDQVEIERQREILNENIKHARDAFDVHLLNLNAKSKIIGKCGNNKKVVSRRISEAFDTMDTIEYCSKILKLVANWKNLKLIFDFNHDHTKYIDPKTTTFTRALIYEDGKVLIGAQNLLAADSKFRVFGIIIHELCHAAMLLIYWNNFNPYPFEQKDDENTYLEVVDESMQLRELNYFVDNAFDYDEEAQDSELIVTYPQALLTYLNDEKEMEEFYQNFHHLVRYSEDVIKLELDKALIIIKLLQDTSKSLKFDDLTDPLKIKVLNSNVDFQGRQTTINDLHELDPEIFDYLTSRNIRDLIMKKKTVKIEVEINFSTIIDRKFVPASSESLIPKTYFQLIEELKNTKVILIESIPGSGITTFLNTTARKLKKDNKELCIAYINLKDQVKIFDEFIDKSLDIKTVLEIFGNKKLSADARAIYLLDGLDKIWTKYGDFWTKIFKIIKKESKIELWIATSPRQTKELENIFNAQAVKFAPFTEDEIRKFIIHHFEIANKYETTRITEMTERVLEFLKYLESTRQSFEPEMNNLSLIQDIISVYIEDDIISKSSNLYQIFSRIHLKMYRKNLDIKYDSVQSNFSIHHVHEILALKLIFSENYVHKNGFKLNELSAIKNFINTSNWTFDDIQNYGFIIAYPKESYVNDGNIPNFFTINGLTANFIHKSFAEFFIARFVINHLTNSNYELSAKEAKIIFKMLEIFAEDSKMYAKIREFIYTSNQINRINEKLQAVITTKIPRIHNGMILGKIETFEFFAKICKNVQELEYKLWMIDSNRRESAFIGKIQFYMQKLIHFKGFVRKNHVSQQDLGNYWKELNIFKKILYPKDELNFEYAIDLVEYCLGPDWNEKLSQGSNKFSINGHIMENIPENWRNNDQIVRLYNFVDENFDAEERDKFINDMKNLCDQRQ